MSDDMIPTSPSQWDQIPFYEPHTPSEFTILFQHDLFDSPGTATSSMNIGDDQTMLTPNTSSGQTIPSPEILSSSSCAGNPSIGELTSPRTGVAKPARRRSRASRKAPTTLLNASLKNFRSLVQQYTGCHTSSSHSSILKNQRGPITLSFGQPSRNDFQTSGPGEQAWHQEQEQQQPQGQQLMVSYNNNSSIDSSPNHSGVNNNNNNSTNPCTSTLTVDDYEECQ